MAIDNKLIKDKWLYWPVLILLIYFFYRLIDQSQLIFHFPLDYNNDISAYIAQLHFLKECGFHNFCQYWYNSFIAFQITPPGWFYFALPFYYLFGNITLATYTTLLLSFILSFFIIYFVWKYLGFSNMQRIAIFSFLFINAISIGNFVRLGRVHELFSWVFFLLFLFFILYYKDKEINNLFFLIIPVYALLIISYFSVAVLASFLFIGFFLIKSNKERFIVFSCFLLSIILVSFWLIPFFIGALTYSSITNYLQSYWLWQFFGPNLLTNIITLIVPIVLFVLFYFYLKSVDNYKKELLFFLPVNFLAILFFSRVVTFLPVLRDINPDPYLVFFLFFIFFFLFKLRNNLINKNLFKFVPLILFLFALLSVSINIIHTPEFVTSEEKIDLDLLLSSFNGSFLVLGGFPSSVYPPALYSYAPIYYNLSTPSGWYPHVKDQEYLDLLKSININNSCSLLLNKLSYFNTTHVIGYSNSCNKFDECSFDFVKSSSGFCLYAL
ncbi:hypothetical protein HYU23_04645 [Candidatus Woesearchaeota archaeon]|nr:hypothetical protein [Candidatus Woesearchaeota archaeon]